MLRNIRKSGTAALLSITMAATATVVGILFSAQATAGTAAAPPVPTAAPLVSMQCGAPSVNTFGFQPYLSLVTQFTTVQRTTAYRKCTGPGFPAIHSGYDTRTVNLNDDCVIMLTSTGTANFNIIWNTTQTTTFTANRSATLVGNVFTITFIGQVTAGLFVGRRVKQVFTADATELNQCLAGAGVVPFLISDVVLTIF
ncbi:hypothetical protein Rhe02_45330 [Rhizocola hellebori]|uniref:Uncharacterized protein n=1 Tax=Rhizocola hellebori TaxID=1392758 RepID=A0A8J3Q9L6_9ACTN|nr:hypothetical protein [Rhizocola hellebori]GIH06466.1 hypothetical protein Rhe02_45330 [Rhizocola hellebori]